MGDRGEQMSSRGDLHPAVLLQRLGPGRLCRSITLFDRLDSTNRVALRAAAAGAREGSLFLAEEQYQGKGRKDRSWHSARGKSLVFSLVLRPAGDPVGLTTLLAYAGAQAIKESTAYLSIKWPNDMYLVGKKVAGILAESKGGATVLGMGVNVNEAKNDFPCELQDTATSISIVTGREHERADVLVAIIERFERAYAVWLESGLEPFIGALEESMLYIGERVCVMSGQETIAGIVRGITVEGYLRLDVQGVERKFASGDVSLKGGET
jgi:BirA family biotin operon repressor/biotin-[acetyl-CoA-carboxylase] ligase